METSELPAGEVSGSVLFYRSPEPLSVEAHGKMGLKRLDKPFAFAATTHLVPLTVTEFSVAALSYPVIFVGQEKQPAVVMGLRDGENLFISPDGEAEPDAYIPAFVRRYPFVFANDDQAKRMILCIDRDSPLVDPNGGDVPLFQGNEPTDFTKGVMDFCREFETERQRTDEFVKLLNGLDLLETKQAVFTPRNPDGSSGEPQVIAEYFAVSEEKLQNLPADKAAELVQNGAMQQIYAHLISLLGWERLIVKAMRRTQQAANDTVGNA